MRQALLGFEHLTDKHTGAKIADVVKVVLERFGIEKRLFGITTDNAANNFTMASVLEDILGEGDFYYDVTKSHIFGNAIRDHVAAGWDGRKLHIPCLAHVIQLTVKAFIEGIEAAPQNDNIEVSVPSQKDFAELEKIKAPFHKTLQKVS
jgi:hypothetical protein